MSYSTKWGSRYKGGNLTHHRSFRKSNGAADKVWKNVVDTWTVRVCKLISSFVSFQTRCSRSWEECFDQLYRMLLIDRSMQDILHTKSPDWAGYHSAFGLKLFLYYGWTELFLYNGWTGKQTSQYPATHFLLYQLVADLKQPVNSLLKRMRDLSQVYSFSEHLYQEVWLKPKCWIML